MKESSLIPVMGNRIWLPAAPGEIPLISAFENNLYDLNLCRSGPASPFIIIDGT